MVVLKVPAWSGNAFFVLDLGLDVVDGVRGWQCHCSDRRRGKKLSVVVLEVPHGQGMLSLSWILALTLSMVSEGVMPVLESQSESTLSLNSGRPMDDAKSKPQACG